MSATFTCPRCSATSANPTDLAEGYCGACHAWTASRGVVDFREVSFPWPEQGGPWMLTVDVAAVDGRATVVGLHVCSYVAGMDGEGGPVRIPGPQGLTEVTHAVVRGLKMGQIADTARAMLAPPVLTHDPVKLRACLQEWMSR